MTRYEKFCAVWKSLTHIEKMILFFMYSSVDQEFSYLLYKNAISIKMYVFISMVDSGHFK